jgi:hypothetical protein
MHSHAKTSAEIDGNLIYVSFLFLRKSRGKVLKKNCSTGNLSASLDGLVPWRACGATGRLAWLIASRQAGCPPASQPRWLCYIRSRLVETWLHPKIEFAGSQRGVVATALCRRVVGSKQFWEQLHGSASAQRGGYKLPFSGGALRDHQLRTRARMRRWTSTRPGPWS